MSFIPVSTRQLAVRSLSKGTSSKLNFHESIDTDRTFFFFFFFCWWCCHGVATQVFYSGNIKYRYHKQSWIWIWYKCLNYGLQKIDTVLTGLEVTTSGTKIKHRTDWADLTDTYMFQICNPEKVYSKFQLLIHEY